MPEGYLHLTCEQRCQIYALLQSGHSQAHIARQIGVDPSTISRELVRNTGARGYRFKQAHEKASQRRQEASDKPRKMTPDLVELIEEKLTQEQWSPDQISGRLAKDGVAFISHERIYQHVWKDKKDGGTLYLHLRHSGKKYNRRKGKNSGRGLISNRVDIDQRPPIVAAKSRIGDWEADTIIGANHKGVVMSHVERTSKYTKLAKLPDKNADSVVQACARVLLPLADQIETITYDNGKEFASHAQIATSLGALSYFAKPYHSWERGLNEHTNGLFRQYFPKGSDILRADGSRTRIKQVEPGLGNPSAFKGSRQGTTNDACLSGCHPQPLAVVFGHAHGHSPAWQSSVPTISTPSVPCSASRATSPHLTYLPTQSFTPEPGSILHVGGVGNNRIGKE